VASEYGSEKWQALTSFEERSSLSSRLMIWRSAGKILEDHWIFGIGLGRFQIMYLEYQRYFTPYLEWAVPEPHNWYFATLFSAGIAGFIGFVILVGRFLFLQNTVFLLDRQKERRFFALITVSIMIFYLVYGLTDTPYFKNDLALSFWLLIGLGLAAVFETNHSLTFEEDRPC
jgi:O-antigen ligase